MNPTTVRPGRSKPLSRRTVVVGTAWAVPAVVVASAAPAFAASGVSVSILGICVAPGNRVTLQFVVSNPTRVTGFVTFNTLTVDGTTVSRVATISLSGTSTPPFRVEAGIPGAVPGTSVAVTLGYSVIVNRVTTTGTANATLTVSSQGQCPF